MAIGTAARAGMVVGGSLSGSSRGPGSEFRNQESRRIPAAFPLLSLALGGCAIHPVQQDVTGVKPKDLVNFIRCEARLAIQDKAIEMLRGETSARAWAFADHLAPMRGQPWIFDPRTTLASNELAFYYRYVSTGIAFDFSFDITEDNGVGGGADPIRLITNGTVGIGLSASGDFKRENLRHFVVSETFQDLLQNKRLVCEPSYRPENHAYPIAGSVGLAELISTFVDLNEVKSLEADKSTSKVFADTLTFTTTVMGSVSPHVIVSPLGTRWGLASPANILASASRMDKHSMIVGLSMDVPKGGGKAGVAAIIPGYSKSVLQRSNVRSPTEQSALDAVSQARIDAYLDRAFH